MSEEAEILNEDSTTDDIAKAALAAKYLAEAAKLDEETRQARAEADEAEIRADRARKEHEFVLAGDKENRTYRFRGIVDEDSANLAIEHLGRWSRMDGKTKKAIHLVLSSPGGSLISGMELFDFLLDLREHGHTLSITARGWAASMGSVLVQAASEGERAMGKEAYLLIHEPSTMVGGTLGAIEDELGFITMANDRILNIFADRCGSSGAANPLSKRQLKAASNRKDRWFDSKEALESGLVDKIR